MIEHINDRLDRSLAIARVGQLFEWDKWHEKIPYLAIDPSWEIRAVPPFHVGVIRYNLRHKEIPGSHVSIYLDCYEMAGCWDKPYWEIYPIAGDCERFLMEDTDGLLAAVYRSFAEQAREDKPAE